MAFHDDRLPVNFERNAIGGPRLSVTQLRNRAGFVKRNNNWSAPQDTWDLKGHFMLLDDPDDIEIDVNTMQDFWAAQEGPTHGWRLKAWSDYQIGDYLNPTTNNQSIGTGDGVEKIFQVFQRRTFGSINYDRDRTKLVTGRAVFLLDDIVKATPGDYTVDLNTGLVTWVVAPAGGVDVQFAGEFDVPVHFVDEQLIISTELVTIGKIRSILVEELKGE